MIIIKKVQKFVSINTIFVDFLYNSAIIDAHGLP